MRTTRSIASSTPFVARNGQPGQGFGKECAPRTVSRSSIGGARGDVVGLLRQRRRSRCERSLATRTTARRAGPARACHARRSAPDDGRGWRRGPDERVIDGFRGMREMSGLRLSSVSHDRTGERRLARPSDRGSRPFVTDARQVPDRGRARVGWEPKAAAGEPPSRPMTAAEAASTADARRRQRVPDLASATSSPRSGTAAPRRSIPPPATRSANDERWPYDTSREVGRRCERRCVADASSERIEFPLDVPLQPRRPHTKPVRRSSQASPAYRPTEIERDCASYSAGPRSRRPASHGPSCRHRHPGS